MIRDTENRIQGTVTGNREQFTRNRIQRTRYREQDTRNRIQQTGYRDQDTENRIQDTENRIQGIGYRMQDSECRTQITEYRIHVFDVERTHCCLYCKWHSICWIIKRTLSI